MENYRSRKVVIAVVSLVVIGAAFGGGIFAGRNMSVTEAKKIELANTTPGIMTPVNKNVYFAPFWSAWQLLNEKSYFSASTTDQDKVWGAIAGLASSFGDQYTVFFPPEDAKQFETQIKGKFGGVGIELDIKDNVLTVVAPLKGTPADKAGILPGDKIVEIDGKNALRMKVDDAVKIIRGEVGTKIELTLAREGKKEPFKITLTRDTIHIPTIDSELKKVATAGGSSAPDSPLKDGVYVIKLYNFSEDSASLFRDALRGFTESGSKKLILDLRGNPGGYLESAVDIAGWFLPAGKVVVRENFGGKQPEMLYNSRGPNIFGKDLKMAILVNRGSASASEILAGALHEYGVATLVGEHTFGKGSVQQLFNVTPETSLKVTIAKWLTPHGLSIADGGIKPDVEVALTADDIEKKKDPQMDKAIELLKKP